MHAASVSRLSILDFPCRFSLTFICYGFSCQVHRHLFHSKNICPLLFHDHDGIVTHGRSREFRMHMKNPTQTGSGCIRFSDWKIENATVSFKKYMPPPLPYFKVNICPLPLPHFASIFFAYLWSFRWPNYIVTLPRYFSFRLPHLNIPTDMTIDDIHSDLIR
jgi:hypothetical protein